MSKQAVSPELGADGSNYRTVDQNHLHSCNRCATRIYDCFFAVQNSTDRRNSKIGKHYSSSICKSYFKLIESMTQQVTHPMVKFQRQVHSLVESQIIKPSDSLWKIALLYGDEWSYWKKELLEFGFTMQDPIGDLLTVEAWDEE